MVIAISVTAANGNDGADVFHVVLDSGASVVLPMTSAACEFVRGSHDRDITIRLERDA